MPVLSSSDQIKALETGVIPVPPEVQADNDARDGIQHEIAKAPAEAPPVEKPPETAEAQAATPNDADDIEGEDGLTPRQKRELTKKMQLSIGKKHRQMKEAEEFAAEQYNEKRLAEQMVERLRREVERLKGEPGASTPATPANARPERASFETDADYEKAVIDWRVNEVLKERDASEAKRRQAEESQKNAERLRERLQVAKSLVPDFEEVSEAASDISVPPHIASAMAESDLFAELGYYLAKHPEDARKIMALPPSRGLVALGKIEAILKPFEKSKVSNGSSKPSQDAGKPASVETGKVPSKPRAAAPIEPLTTPSEPQSDAPVNVRNVRQEIDRWQKNRSGDVLRRKRH